MIEAGTLGRMVLVRLKPNQDLVGGIEAAARDAGIAEAVVRGAIGSLVEANLAYGTGTIRKVAGPGVEILTLSGRLSGGTADLRGTVSGPDAQVHGGRFVPGSNAICITLELVLQEWQGS